MADISQYLEELNIQKNQLAENLTLMGVEAEGSEKLNTLVPKVLECSSDENVEFISNANGAINAKVVVSNEPSYSNIAKYFKSIVLPEGITEIGNLSFYQCRSLEYLHIPSTVTSINAGSLANTSIKTLTIPAGVTAFGASAQVSPVKGCTELTDITFLNPECNIYMNADIIPVQTVIHGYQGSTAQEYAAAFDRTFVVLL